MALFLFKPFCKVKIISANKKYVSIFFFVDDSKKTIYDDFKEQLFYYWRGSDIMTDNKDIRALLKKPKQHIYCLKMKLSRCWQIPNTKTSFLQPLTGYGRSMWAMKSICGD